MGRDYDEIQKTWAPEVFIRESEQVAAKVQAYVELGCTGFYPWCADYPDTESMRLFAEQVIPEVRRAVG